MPYARIMIDIMTVMIEIQRAIPSQCQKALFLPLWELQYKKDLLKV